VVGLGGGGVGGARGGEMTQTLYAHMNKIKIKKKRLRCPNGRSPGREST
jgi:hypothetical protein